jgi:multicomponent Na+:H+ antiporter subunit G
VTLVLAIFVGLLLLVSLFYNLFSVISMYRFPDVYNRIHGVAQCTTCGTIFSVFAVLTYSLGRWLLEGEARFMVFFIHAAIAGVVLLFTNPTAIHTLARAMYRSGIVPEPCVLDHLDEKYKEMKKREGGETA